nr:PREDICTED: agamous-like MADS-box protein AGL9 homolog isoform X1 [Musa acuminata subsp. malaccensis]
MGRGKVELKRIENKVNRQVSFAKRRNGLLKKAYELSLLCDVEVALVIFSSRGRLFEFCSSSSVLKTIERYRSCRYNVSEHTLSSNEPQMSYQEYLKLKERVEYLQHSQNNLLGEDLGPLSIHDLQQLENQIEMSLKQIRSTKMQVMFDQLCDLNHKEQALQEANTNLRSCKKLVHQICSSCHGQMAIAVQLMSLLKQQDSISPKEKNHPCKLDSIYPAQLLGTMKPQKAMDSSRDGFENLSSLTSNLSSSFYSRIEEE